MKVVMSIGNPIKSDDNIGNVILENIDIGNILKICAETTPENFISKLSGFDKIIIIDALGFEGNVGDVKIFNLEDIQDQLASTHSIPISIIRKFLPNPEIYVIGIKTKNLDYGETLSKELEEKVEEISRKVEKLIISL